MKTTTLSIEAYSDDATLTLGRQFSNEGSAYVILSYNVPKNKWTTINPVKIRVDAASTRTVATLLASAKELQEAIGKARDPGEIIKRFMECSESEQVEVTRPWGDKYKHIEQILAGPDSWYDNPTTLAAQIADMCQQVRTAVDSKE